MKLWLSISNLNNVPDSLLLLSRIVDFDAGGRAPLELTDVDADEVEVGMRVEPTFRRLFTADEIHNYFWKVKPVR